MKDKYIYIKIAICILLVNYLISNTIELIYINERIQKLEPKLIIRGEILEMSYFNVTFSNEVNYNLLPRQPRQPENITEHYYNLTISNQLIKSIEYYSFEISIIKSYNIQIGSIIEIWDLKDGFIDLKVMKGDD